MKDVTVNNDFRITIPKEIRESLRLKPGQKMLVKESGDGFELIPVPSIEDARGMLKGIDTTVIREPDRF